MIQSQEYLSLPKIVIESYQRFQPSILCPFGFYRYKMNYKIDTPHSMVLVIGYCHCVKKFTAYSILHQSFKIRSHFWGRTFALMIKVFWAQKTRLYNISRFSVNMWREKIYFSLFWGQIMIFQWLLYICEFPNVIFVHHTRIKSRLK